MAVVSVHGTEYHIDDKLKPKWDRIKDGKLTKEDDDKVFIVDGRERSGKSVFAFQQACYIDPTLVGDLSRICFTAEEFLSAIRKTNSNAEQTKVVIFDEAFRGLASRAAMSKINKKLIQALMEVGQKNLVIFIVLPSFFMLDLYPAMLRSDALFHIKKDKITKQRSFHVYSRAKKGKLYQIGVRKGWTYSIPTRFKGRFSKKFPGGDEFEAAYRKKKYQSLVESNDEAEKPSEDSRFKLQRDQLIRFLIDSAKYSQRKLERDLNSYGFKMSRTTIHEILSQKPRKEEKPTEMTEKEDEVGW